MNNFLSFPLTDFFRAERGLAEVILRFRETDGISYGDNFYDTYAYIEHAQHAPEILHREVIRLWTK